MRRIINFLHASVTLKGTLFLLLGSLVSQAMGFLVIALLTRNLEPAAFGFFITAFAFSQLLGDLFEFGINPALLTFASGKSGKKRYSYIKTTFLIKSAIATVLFLIIFFGAELISLFVFKDDLMVPYIRISALGSAILLLVVWSQNVFNSENKFFLSSIINSTTNVFRFLAVSLLVLTGLATPFISYFFFQVAIGLSLFLFFFFYGFKFFRGKFNKVLMKELVVFGLPIGLSFSIGAIYTRIDQILVFNMLGSAEAGVYGLGYRLASVFVLGISSFGAVISPRFASIPDDHYWDYFKKTFLAICGMVAGAILAILVSPYLVPIIFGTVYIASVPIFQILTIGIIFFMLQVPFNTVIIFRFKKSNFLVPIALLSLGIMYFLLIYLIPLYKTAGAAWAFVVLNFTQLIFYVGYFWYLNSRGKK